MILSHTFMLFSCIMLHSYGYSRSKSICQSRLKSNHLLVDAHPHETSSNDDRSTLRLTFMEQKNYLLLDRFSRPPNGNLSAAAIQYVNLCDESFDSFLSDQITKAHGEYERQQLGTIRYEVDIARRYKLMEGDKLLRSILQAGGLKQMEAKLAYYLARSEIDMAFMVILQLNIENAMRNNVTTAVQVMTHLGTLIAEYKERNVSPPLRLLRILSREDDTAIRKQILRQKLLYTTSSGEVLSSDQIEARARGLSILSPALNVVMNDEMLPSLSVQCENFLVSAVKSWGDADVKIDELNEIINDILAQMLGTGVQKLSRKDLERICSYLREEIEDVKGEFSL